MAAAPPARPGARPPPQAAGPLPAGIYNPALGERARSPWRRLPPEQGGQAQTAHNQWINASPRSRSRPNSTGAPARPLSPRGELAGEPRVRPPRSHARRAEQRRSLHARLGGETKRARGVGEARKGCTSEQRWVGTPGQGTSSEPPTLWTQSSYSDESRLKLPGTGQALWALKVAG